MTVAEVTVAYVNPPKGRARSGSIKDTDGGYYGIAWPAMQNDFKPGGTYKIEYEQNGQYRNVTRSKLVSAAPPVASAHSGGGGDPQLAERIFVCGAINATMSNPNVNINSPEWGKQGCINLVNHWRAVWAATFGGQGGAKNADHRSVGDEMSDEIPF